MAAIHSVAIEEAIGEGGEEDVPHVSCAVDQRVKGYLGSHSSILEVPLIEEAEGEGAGGGGDNCKVNSTLRMKEGEMLEVGERKVGSPSPCQRGLQEAQAFPPLAPSS